MESGKWKRRFPPRKKCSINWISILPSNAADYQVAIDVTRFDCVPGGEAVLTAFWTLKGMDDSTPGIRRKSVFRAPLSGTDFSGIVDAQNQTLTTFSREIAAAIQSLER